MLFVELFIDKIPRWWQWIKQMNIDKSGTSDKLYDNTTKKRNFTRTHTTNCANTPKPEGLTQL